jgi:Lrp/AsnC family transcriptional regulator for asnA, asnC and gidA
MNGKALDALDRTIIDLISKDGRVSNRQIAAELGVTEGTIRARLKRLQQDNLIRFTAVVDYRLAGSPKLVLMGIHAEPSAVGRLSEQISAMPEIGCVIVMLGRYSLLAMGLFTRLEDSIEIANNRILSLPGVQHVETSVAVQTPKYDFRMAMIT